MNVVVDQLLTNYHISGKGKLVLFLHGWGDSIKGLSGLQKELSKKYQVVSLDLPGFGGTQTPDETWTLDDYCKFVTDFLEKLGLSNLYAVAGHSNGGAIAIRAINMQLLQPQKLVLIASAGIRNEDQGRLQLLKIATKTGKAATSLLPFKQRQKIRKKLYQAVGSDILVVPHLEETFKNIVGQDVQADAANIKIKTLLIYGSLDEATPVSYGDKLQTAIAGSKLEVIAGAGHFVHQEKLQEVDDLIEAFLK